MRYSVQPKTFEYEDCDTFENEIAEFYTYSEMVDFPTNLQAFKEEMIENNLSCSWQETSETIKKIFITRLLNKLDLNNRTEQIKAAKAILYIAQGCWDEVESILEQKKLSQINSLLLYRSGAFMNFTQLLYYETNTILEEAKTNFQQKYVEDSEYLRIILAVLYTITEVIRHEKDIDNKEYYEDIEEFRSELQNSTAEDDNLIVKLFNMVEQFATIENVAFPIKKILLLLWKLLLVLLGGLSEARKLTEKKRRKANLPVNHDTPYLNNEQNSKTQQILEERIVTDFCTYNNVSREELVVRYDRKYISTCRKCLCWKPKVTYKYYINTIHEARKKYLDLYLPNDHTTIYGLPLLVQESLKVLKDHVYIPMGQVEIEEEDNISKYPLTKPETIEPTPNEFLYSALFPKLPQYTSALVDIIFSVINTNCIKNQVLSDVATRKPPKTRLQVSVSHLDGLRHERILFKAISAILLLLLKHFKANHILQFEHLCNLLMETRFFPVIFDFFSRLLIQVLNAMFVSKAYEFPNFLIGEQEQVTLRNLFGVGPKQYLWTGLFICTNCLRIINKLVKGKEDRIKLLVVSRTETILRKVISLNAPICTLYSLKLIKMQIKFFGKDWRKYNTDLITLIYLNNRYNLHRYSSFLSYDNSINSLNFKQDGEKRKAEMANLIERFHKRRYLANDVDDSDEYDNDIMSVLGKPFRAFSL